MHNRLTQAADDAEERASPSRSASAGMILRDTITGFYMAARHALMLIGLLTLLAVAVLLLRPDVTAHALAMLQPSTDVKIAQAEQPAPHPVPDLVPTAVSGASAAGASLAAATTELNEELMRQQERVANWIARRYRVASDATGLFVQTAYQTAKELKLDPLLILSVMAIESRFNPFAESPAGAQGLMQVMSRVHKDKFEPLGGIEAALNPIANIKVGSRILKEYVTRGGSIEAGLKMYVGAAALDTDFGYGAKVLGEYARLKDVAMGRKVSIYATTAARKPAPKPVEPPVQMAQEQPTETAQPVVQDAQVASAM